MPDDHRQLASDGDGRDVVATLGAGNPVIEGAQRSWSAHGLPSCLHQQVAGVRPALLGDPAMMGRAVAGLVDARVEPDDTRPACPGRRSARSDRSPPSAPRRRPCRYREWSSAVSRSDRLGQLCAMSRSTPFSTSLRRSYSWICCSTASCSSPGRSCARSHARPLPPNRSACGHLGIRLAWRIDWMIDLRRALCRTI